MGEAQSEHSIERKEADHEILKLPMLRWGENSGVGAKRRGCPHLKCHAGRCMPAEIAV